MNLIDFSCKHNILIENDDGSRQPMDEPYFRSLLVAPGTWQVLSDGDYTYLAEGDDEALVIDSGYGCGNIRAYCQSLTNRPVTRIANTHDHFDHTANNAYFDCAYMSAATYERRTLPFPSFSGIEFPRDYPVQIINEGYLFHLGGRELETYTLNNHAAGSLAFLDRKNRLFFTGDEIGAGRRYECNYSVEHCYGYVKKIYDLRSCYDTFCTGGGLLEGSVIVPVYKALEYVLLHPSEGTPVPEAPSNPAASLYSASADPQTVTVYRRRGARPCDRPGPRPHNPNLRQLTYCDCTILYDISRVMD